MKEAWPSVSPSDKPNESQPGSSSFPSYLLPAISSFTAFWLGLYTTQNKDRCPPSQRHTECNHGRTQLLLTKASQWAFPENVHCFTEPRDLSLNTRDFWGQRTLCCRGGLAPCRVVTSIAGLYPLGAASNPSPQVVTTKCL